MKDEKNAKTDYARLSNIKIVSDVKPKYNDIDISVFSNSKYSSSIKKFVEVMTNEIPSDQLVFLYNNFNELKIKDSNLYFYNLINRCYKSDAIYKSKHNTITFSDRIDEFSIFHELLHVATTIMLNKTDVHTGFSVYYEKPLLSLGRGINEGYTELMVKKYFAGCKQDYFSGYDYHLDVAQIIDKIVGSNKMQELYFKANLRGLIEEMSNYISVSDVVNFLIDCDVLVNYESRKLGRYEDSIREEIETRVCKMLIKMVSNKITELVKEGKIDSKIAEEEYLKYFENSRYYMNVCSLLIQYKTKNRSLIEPADDSLKEGKHIV